MSASHLILLPGEADYPPSRRAALIEALRGLEFLGAAMDMPVDMPGHCHDETNTGVKDGQCYQVGERFLDLLIFMGCSPAVLTDPSQAREQGFCHVYVPPAAPAPVFLAGEPLRAPRCPACAVPVPDWRTRLWGGPFACPDCGEHNAPPYWIWGRRAGWARAWIEVHGVFDGEAVPGEELMRALSAPDGVQWRYLYGRRRSGTQAIRSNGITQV